MISLCQNCYSMTKTINGCCGKCGGKKMNEEKKSVSRKKLSIKLVGHDYVDAFENVERTGNQPHFKGDGVAVWIHDIKPKEKEE